ncbi:MAG: OmpA family protein [Nitrospinae bacterium]|nr:OmpA family protein [Nitrospinota bacterium]
MENMENAALLKEQLRLKNLELKKREIEKSKSEAKVKHILALNQKTIDELKIEIVKKEEEFRLQADTGRLSFAPVETRGEARGEHEVEIREVVVQDPALMETLVQLRQKNNELQTQINQEMGEKGKLTREKTLLLKEVKRIKEDPDSPEKLKQKVAALEKRSQDIQGKYEALIQEKNSLVKSFEKAALGVDVETGETILSPETSSKLKKELENLQRENFDLQDRLAQEQKKFNVQFREELEGLEKEWAKKLKRAKQDRDKAAQLADEIMDAGSQEWLVTYADMTTLLLTFFILYYSIAAMNMGKFKEAILGEQEASIGLLELLDSAEVKERIADLTGLKSKDILNEVNELTENKQFESQVSVSRDQAKIVLRVPGQTLFPPGTADLQQTARPILDELARVCNNYPEYKINIQGHTDDTAISTERFPTNWELSAARATAVLRYFLDKGIKAQRMTATGYADIFPVATNDTDQGRAQNRRVEIVLEKEKK